MKKFLKIVLSVILTAALSCCLFYCLIAGAPGADEGFIIYIVSAAGFSISLPVLLCACVYYISYLEKLLDKE